MLHQVFNDAMEALLAGWHRHMDLAASTDNIFKLAESRLELDALHRRAFRARRTPEDHEPDGGSLPVYCPFLETMVYIPTNEVRYTPDDVLTFKCQCDREVGHRPQEWLRAAGEPAVPPPGYPIDGRTRLGQNATR